MLRIILLFSLLPLSAVAQKKLNLTFFGGFSNYSGDLQEKRFTMDQSHRSFAAGLSYELKPKLLLRGALQFGTISATDKKGKPSLRERNLNFATNLYEASLVADYSLFDIRDHRITPYVFAGLAAFHFNPYTTDTLGRGIALQPLGTEGQGLREYPGRKMYKLNQISVPMGIGFRVRITENAVLGYEIGFRKTFTDYLDDVSKTYVDEATLASQRGRRAVDIAFRGDELKDLSLDYPADGTKRGSAKYKDWYYFSGITLSIGIMNDDGRLFGKKIMRGSVECPRVL
jgi:hypothetical protein